MAEAVTDPHESVYAYMWWQISDRRLKNGGCDEKFDKGRRNIKLKRVQCRPLAGAPVLDPKPPLYNRTFSSNDPTIGITHRQSRRESVALSKVSFVIPDDSPEGELTIYLLISLIFHNLF